MKGKRVFQFVLRHQSPERVDLCAGRVNAGEKGVRGQALHRQVLNHRRDGKGPDWDGKPALKPLALMKYRYLMALPVEDPEAIASDKEVARFLKLPRPFAFSLPDNARFATVPVESPNALGAVVNHIETLVVDAETARVEHVGGGLPRYGGQIHIGEGTLAGDLFVGILPN